MSSRDPVHIASAIREVFDLLEAAALDGAAAAGPLRGRVREAQRAWSRSLDEIEDARQRTEEGRGLGD
jgi:hypothetical protein